MTDETLIADLVRAGLDPELVGRVANAIVEAGQFHGIPVQSRIDKIRERDRERKRQQRDIQAESSGNSTENKVGTELALSSKKEDLDTKKERKKESKSRGRASRIPLEWQLSETDREFARSKGMPPSRIPLEAEKFKNYWTAKSGAAATKLDWSATWKNWVLTALERQPGGMPTAPPRPAGERVWEPPPGCEPLEVIRERMKNAAENPAQVRRATGVGKNGADHHEELQLEGGKSLFDPHGETRRRASNA